jgi:hypothetical protein
MSLKLTIQWHCDAGLANIFIWVFTKFLQYRNVYGMSTSVCCSSSSIPSCLWHRDSLGVHVPQLPRLRVKRVHCTARDWRSFCNVTCILWIGRLTYAVSLTHTSGRSFSMGPFIMSVPLTQNMDDHCAKLSIIIVDRGGCTVWPWC